MWEDEEERLDVEDQVGAVARTAWPWRWGTGWLCRTSSGSSYLEDTYYSMILVLSAVEHIRKMDQALSVGSIYSIYRHETDNGDF